MGHLTFGLNVTLDGCCDHRDWNETRLQPETQQLLASLRLLGRNDTPHARETTAAA